MNKIFRNPNCFRFWLVWNPSHSIADMLTSYQYQYQHRIDHSEERTHFSTIHYDPHVRKERETERAREKYTLLFGINICRWTLLLSIQSRILWNAWNCLLFKPLSGVQVNTVNETDLWMPCIVLFIHSFLSVNSDPACVRHTIPRTVIAVQGQGYSRVQACTSLSFSPCVCTAEYHRMYCVSPLDFNSEARKLFDCNISLWYEFLAIFDCTSQLSWCSGEMNWKYHHRFSYTHCRCHNDSTNNNKKTNSMSWIQHATHIYYCEIELHITHSSPATLFGGVGVARKSLPHSGKAMS